MFKLIAILCVFFLIQSTPVLSSEADDMKQKALKDCETPVILMTGFKKALVVSECKCLVEKTDYNIILEGDKQRVDEHAKENALACAMKNVM